MKEFELRRMCFDDILEHINDLEDAVKELEDKISQLKIEIDEHREDRLIEMR